MSSMTDVAMEISVSLGLDGEITKDVIHVAEEVFRVHRVENPKDKALQTMRIGKLIRELRAEIKRDQELFEQGKLAKRVCAWCEAESADSFMGYTEGSGITHGICERHAKELKESC